MRMVGFELGPVTVMRLFKFGKMDMQKWPAAMFVGFMYVKLWRVNQSDQK